MYKLLVRTYNVVVFLNFSSLSWRPRQLLYAECVYGVYFSILILLFLPVKLRLRNDRMASDYAIA